MVMGRKGDLSEFDRGLMVGVRRAGLSVSETANLLGYSRTTVSRVYRDWSEKRVVFSSRHLCGRKSLVDDRGLKKLEKLIQGHREATVAELTAIYNDGQQKAISARTTRRMLKRLGYSKTPLGRGVKIPFTLEAKDDEETTTTTEEPKKSEDTDKTDAEAATETPTVDQKRSD